MSFSPAFVISIPIPINPSAITLLDSSTGSDGTITSRQILLYQANNTQLTLAIAWAYPSPNPITIYPLTADIALTIVVNWLNSSGATIYTSQQIANFTANGELFYYQLTQAQSSNPSIIQDSSYYYWKMVLRVELDGSDQAITVGADVQGSNQCIVRYQQLLNNQAIYFGSGATTT